MEYPVRRHLFFPSITSLARVQICIRLTGMASQRVLLFVKGNMVWAEYAEAGWTQILEDHVFDILLLPV